MKVLIAVDNSPFSMAVLDEAAHATWTEDTRFMVLSVVAVPSRKYWQDRGLPVPRDVIEKLTKEADHLVIDTISLLKEHFEGAHEVEGRVCYGHACDGILQVAREWKADLIMLGSHGYTGVKKLVLGSVVEGVLEQAPCSVEVVKFRGELPEPRLTKKKKMTVLY